MKANANVRIDFILQLTEAEFNALNDLLANVPNSAVVLEENIPYIDAIKKTVCELHDKVNKDAEERTDLH